MTITSTDAPKGAAVKKKEKKVRETKPFSTKMADYFHAAPGFDTLKAKLDKQKKAKRPNRFKASDRSTKETMNRGEH